jgi:hypothetical protein
MSWFLNENEVIGKFVGRSEILSSKIPPSLIGHWLERDKKNDGKICHLLQTEQAVSEVY